MSGEKRGKGIQDQRCQMSQPKTPLTEHDPPKHDLNNPLTIGSVHRQVTLVEAHCYGPTIISLHLRHSSQDPAARNKEDGGLTDPELVAASFRQSTAHDGTLLCLILKNPAWTCFAYQYTSLPEFEDLQSKLLIPQ